MLDKIRFLSKLDELDTYLNELESIMQKAMKNMWVVWKRREFVKGLRMGLPTEEGDVFEKMRRREILFPNKWKVESDEGF